jgi:hypothetical protein
VRIGKKRGISFGSALDYYYTSTGTDILASYYTFQDVEVSAVELFVFGSLTCISIIGVDLR